MDPRASEREDQLIKRVRDLHAKWNLNAFREQATLPASTLIASCYLHYVQLEKAKFELEEYRRQKGRAPGKFP